LWVAVSTFIHSRVAIAIEKSNANGFSHFRHQTVESMVASDCDLFSRMTAAWNDSNESNIALQESN
jgi:hypothetical protein